MPAQRRALARSAVRVLGPVGWVVIGACLAMHLSLGEHSARAAQTILVWSMGVFFVTMLARLGVAAYCLPHRRTSLLLLLGSVTLWALGAMSVNASSHSELTRFPAPGEGFFLAAYVGMVGYLVTDAMRRSERGANIWLDVVVTCGGTACLASALLLMPVGPSFAKTGLALLLALLYPLIDLALAVLVVAQVILRARPDPVNAAMLCLGFVLFAAADAQFVVDLAAGTYQFSAIDDVTWGAAFALIVGSACRQRDTVLKAVPRSQGPALLLAASAVAVIALVLHPRGGIGPYIVVPAVVTLAAAGLRLVRALRQAGEAAEAFALSRTDDLTLLPNRRAVRARLDESVAAGKPVALLVLDLDGFKEVNDTLGHAAGDTVLQLTAMQIRDALAPELLVARLGGDEFAIVVQTSDELELIETANTVLEAMARPVRVDGIEIAPSASVGIAVHSDDESGSTEMFRRADVAMYQAKLTRLGAVLYDSHHDEFSRPRLQLGEDLRRGIAEGQLCLNYQPQVDAATQRICGVEALLRWCHPTQGTLSPVVFLPAARRAGLMLMLSEEVARLAATDLAGWHARGFRARVAINVAPPELLSGLFVPRLHDVLSQHHIGADEIVVELTEDSFLADPERAREIITDMRESGLQIAIDDYGTGYSSLSYLRDLPVNELKVDRSFVSNMRDDTRSRMIVASTLQMASALGMRTVAEGVEDAATAADLVALGVDVLQGYHLARPMPADEVEDWVRTWTRNAHLALGGSGERTVDSDATHSARVPGPGRRQDATGL